MQEGSIVVGSLSLLRSREFSTKSFNLAYEGTHPNRVPSSFVWLGLAPPQVEAFCWLVVVGKVSMVDNLRRRGLTSNDMSDICVMCGNEEELVNYLFLHRDRVVKSLEQLYWKVLYCMVLFEEFGGCGGVLTRWVPGLLCGVWPFWKMIPFAI